MFKGIEIVSLKIISDNRCKISFAIKLFWDKTNLGGVLQCN